MNLFSVSSLIIFFASLGLGLIIYSGNRESKLNRSWFLVSLAVAFWGLGLWGVTNSLKEQSSLWWQYLLDGVGVFIPVLYFNFALNFLDLEKEKKLARIFSFFVGASLFVLSFTSLFKKGMAFRFGFHWVDPGRLYYLFPLVFIVYLGYSAILLFKRYRKVTGVAKQQTKYVFLSLLIGLGAGATNFFPQLFNFYPFGNYFIILYIFFMSYPVLKHNLFNTKVITTEFFAGAISLVFLFNIFVSETVIQWIVNSLLFVLIAIFSFLLVRSVVKEVEAKERLEKLTRELQTVNKKLQLLDQAKSEFISIASHQLRTPLTAIRGFSSMILEGDFGPTTPEIQDKVDKIMQSSTRLMALVDDLLTLSRMEQGRLKYEWKDVNLTEMTRSVFEELDQQAKKKGLEFKAEISARDFIVRADETKLRQVVMNLIDNAIKYTEKGQVSVFLSEENHSVVLKVIDTGIGISLEGLSRLFQKFSRGEHSSLVWTEGTGLGLYVARIIIEEHRGKITAYSDGEGKGSEFVVALPLKD